MTLHIAIPVMQELELLPATLDCIANQCNAEPFHVYICVNQPEKLSFSSPLPDDMQAVVDRWEGYICMEKL